jgi:hypothetical protein
LLSPSMSRGGYGARAGKGAERLLAGTAHRTFPVIGKILKASSFGDLALSIALVRIIDVPAIDRLALPHLLGCCHLTSPYSF